MIQSSERAVTASVVGRANLGFLLAKASQRWNELLYARFSERGFGEVRPAYGSILLTLFEEDGLRIGELGRSARPSLTRNGRLQSVPRERPFSSTRALSRTSPRSSCQSEAAAGGRSKRTT